MMTLDSWKNVILRPLALFSLSFFLVSCAVVPVGGARLLLPSAVFLVLSAVFALISLLFVKNRKALRSFFAVFMLFFGVASALFSSYLNFTKNIDPYISLDGKEVCFSGTVTDIIYSKPYGDLYTVRTDTLEGKSCAANIYLYGEHGFALGDRVRVTAKITALTDVNGAPTEEGQYGYSDGIVISAEATETEYTGSAGFDLSREAKNIRSYVSEGLTDILGDRCGGFCAAIITGDRAQLPADIHRDFKALGISHILALSGMHLSVICTLIYALTGRLSIHIRRLSVAAVVVFYMLLTGFSPSVTRAGIMLLTALFANMLRRGGDMVTSIGIAAFLICIVDPFAPGDVGLQLSVAAVFAIALAIGAAKRKEPKNGSAREKGLRYGIKRLAKAALSALYVCVCVNIFLLPLEWLYFSFISPAAPFVSVIISFLVSLLLFLLPFLILSFPISALSAAIALPVKLLCKTIFFICAGLSDIPKITVSIIYPGALLLCILAVFAFIVFAVSKKRVKAVSGIICIAVFASLVGGGYIYSALMGERAVIDYINCNKSDAVTVCTDGKATVIDIGNGYSTVIKEAYYKVLDRKLPEIENLVLTHLHNKYPDSLSGLFDRYRVRRLLVPLSEENTALCEKLRQICREKSVEFLSYEPGEEIALSEGFSILTYADSYIKRSVQPIVRFDLKIKNRTVSYLGSSYTEAFPNVKLDCDCVILGSHGPLYKSEIAADMSFARFVIFGENAKEYCPFSSSAAPSLLIDGSVFAEKK